MTTSLASSTSDRAETEPAILSASASPRCTQCNEPLPATPRRWSSAPLCADCALDGLPHTD